MNYERVSATKHAPHDPRRLLKCIYGLAEIIERGAGVLVERPRVIQLHPEREMMTLAENASRHGKYLAQEIPGFFEAPYNHKAVRIVVGRKNGM